jgi:hypothetical protein
MLLTQVGLGRLTEVVLILSDMVTPFLLDGARPHIADPAYVDGHFTTVVRQSRSLFDGLTQDFPPRDGVCDNICQGTIAAALGLREETSRSENICKDLVAHLVVCGAGGVRIPPLPPQKYGSQESPSFAPWMISTPNTSPVQCPPMASRSADDYRQTVTSAVGPNTPCHAERDGRFAAWGIRVENKRRCQILVLVEEG